MSMSRYYDVTTEAAYFDSSDDDDEKESQFKIRIPKFELKSVDTWGSLCENLAQASRGHNNATPSASRSYFESRQDNENSNPWSKFSTKESETKQNVKLPETSVDSYELERFSKNLMIIFNHEYFLNDTRREGTRQDVNALKRTFQQFRFHVTTHNDLEKKDLLAELDKCAYSSKKSYHWSSWDPFHEATSYKRQSLSDRKVSEQNFSDCGCICVAILTHGSDHGYLEAYDEWYSEREVYLCFSTRTKPSLVGKPVIFLVQACRGNNLAPSVSVLQSNERPNIELDSGSRTEGNLSYPAESNMIIFHSCFFGRASVRDRDRGTWFIQTVCEQINKYASYEHLEDIFKRVRKIVATELEAKGAKQMPVSTSALVKDLFLKRNQSSGI